MFLLVSFLKKVKMKATKLTPKQRELFEALKQTGGTLRRHIKKNNLVCWRLMDKEFNPISNYSMSIIDKLISKDLLQLTGFDYVLKATSENSVTLA